MTEGYKIFERQYYAMGREKLDGYTLSNLDDITHEEKADVLQKLASEVADFYGAVEPLFYLDPLFAVDVLEKIISTQSIDQSRKSYPIFFALWDITKNEEYLNKFIECRNNISNVSKLDFYSLAASKIEVKDIYEMVVFAIYDEVDDMARGVAAKAILNKYNIPFDGVTKEDHRRYWEILKSGSDKDKAELLDKLSGSVAV